MDDGGEYPCIGVKRNIGDLRHTLPQYLCGQKKMVTFGLAANHSLPGVLPLLDTPIFL